MRKRTSSSRRVARLTKPTARQGKTQGSKVGSVGRFFRKVGQLGGAIASGYTGMPGLAKNGRKWGGAVSKFLGYGSYVNANAIEEPGRPMMANFIQHESQEGVFRYSSREYLGEVRGFSLFRNVKTFRMNPGDIDTFPWLSTIARKFERYRFKSLMFHFQSSASDSNQTIQLGDILGCHIDNPALGSPTTRQAVEIKSFSRSGSINKNLNMPVECDHRYINKEWDYVRTKDISEYSNAELTDYDHGRYEMYTLGVGQNDVVIGSLMLSYEIEFAGQTNEVSNTAATPAANLTMEAWRQTADTTVYDFYTSEVAPVASTYDSTFSTPGSLKIDRFNKYTDVLIGTTLHSYQLPFIRFPKGLKGFFHVEIEFQLYVVLGATPGHTGIPVDAILRWSGPSLDSVTAESGVSMFSMTGGTTWEGDDSFGSGGHWQHVQRIGGADAYSDMNNRANQIHCDFYMYTDGAKEYTICLGQWRVGARWVNSQNESYEYYKITQVNRKILRVTQLPENQVAKRVSPTTFQQTATHGGFTSLNNPTFPSMS